MNTDPATEDRERSLDDLMPSGLCVAMVNTMVGRTHSSRPVTVADAQGTRLSFLVAQQADWVRSIAGQEALVHVTVANDAHSLYLSLNGVAIVVHDADEAGRLWSKPAGVWFDGPDDPDLAVLHFDVNDGHYWDGPNGRVGRAVALARAAMSGQGDDLGTEGSVATRP